MIWDAEVECAPPEELRRRQNSHLKAMLERVSRTAFYRQSATRSLAPASVTLDDLPGLFFTSKQDLRHYYPFDIVQNAYGYGLFTGGLGFTTAAWRSGPRSSR